MRFDYIIAYIREVEHTVAFYEKAFGPKRRFVDESDQYAAMETGETPLAFASNEIAQSNLYPVASARTNRRNSPPAWRWPSWPRTWALPFVSRWKPGRPRWPSRRPSLGARPSPTWGPGWFARGHREREVVG